MELKGSCKICGKRVSVKLNTNDVDEAYSRLKRTKFYICPGGGHHVFAGSMFDNVLWDTRSSQEKIASLQPKEEFKTRASRVPEWVKPLLSERDIESIVRVCASEEEAKREAENLNKLGDGFEYVPIVNGNFYAVKVVSQVKPAEEPKEEETPKPKLREILEKLKAKVAPKPLTEKPSVTPLPKPEEEAKPVPKPEVKPEVKPVPKPEVKPKAAPKPEVKDTGTRIKEILDTLKKKVEKLPGKTKAAPKSETTPERKESSVEKRAAVLADKVKSFEESLVCLREEMEKIPRGENPDLESAVSSVKRSAQKLLDELSESLDAVKSVAEILGVEPEKLKDVLAEFAEDPLDAIAGEKEERSAMPETVSKQIAELKKLAAGTKAERIIREIERLAKVADVSELLKKAKSVVSAMRRPRGIPEEALKKLWEASGRSKAKCIQKVKDEPFLKVRPGETREEAAARFCRWLEGYIEGKYAPTRSSLVDYLTKEAEVDIDALRDALERGDFDKALEIAGGLFPEKLRDDVIAEINEVRKVADVYKSLEEAKESPTSEVISRALSSLDEVIKEEINEIVEVVSEAAHAAEGVAERLSSLDKSSVKRPGAGRALEEWIRHLRKKGVPAKKIRQFKHIWESAIKSGRDEEYAARAAIDILPEYALEEVGPYHGPEKRGPIKRRAAFEEEFEDEELEERDEELEDEELEEEEAPELSEEDREALARFLSGFSKVSRFTREDEEIEEETVESEEEESESEEETEEETESEEEESEEEEVESEETEEESESEEETEEDEEDKVTLSRPKGVRKVSQELYTFASEAEAKAKADELTRAGKKTRVYQEGGVWKVETVA